MPDLSEVLGDFDAAHTDESQASSVQYVKFHFSSEKKEALNTEGTGRPLLHRSSRLLFQKPGNVGSQLARS